METQEHRCRVHAVERGYEVEAVFPGDADRWGITLREGRHEGLISFETFQAIRDILNGRRERLPAVRKDSKEDFPLRGFVVCDCCGRRMTGGWSKGKYEYYAYYRCMTRGCEAKNKCAPAARIEGAFSDIMQQAQPT